MRAVALFMLPGATYVDPELSWKYESGPGRDGLRPRHRAGRRQRRHALDRLGARVRAGRRQRRRLYRLRLTPNRMKVDVSDPALADRVADNLAKFDPTETESIVSAPASAPRRTSSKDPTATSTSSRSPTARST